MTLRVGHFPNHGPSVTEKTTAQIAAQDVDSAGISEGYHAVPLLRANHKGIDTYASSASKVDRFGRRPSYDNPVIVKGHRLVDQGTYKITPAYKPNLKWNPERWLNWVAYDHEFGTICHITVHPDPNTHTRRYRRAIKALEKRIVWAKAQGWLVVVTGDLQTGDYHVSKGSGRAVTRSLRPADVFARHGLHGSVHHLDWVVVDKALRVTDVRVIPTSRLTPGEDHPWIILSAEKH